MENPGNSKITTQNMNSTQPLATISTSIATSKLVYFYSSYISSLTRFRGPYLANFCHSRSNLTFKWISISKIDFFKYQKSKN